MPTITTAYLVVVAVPSLGVNPLNMPPLAGVPPVVGQVFQLLPVNNLIGREPSPDTTIVLPWHHVSRRQSQIDFDGQSTWDIQDLSSRNGTFVNGQKLQPFALCPLCDGDRIQVAGTLSIEFLFTFHPVSLEARPQTYEEFLEEDEFR